MESVIAKYPQLNHIDGPMRIPDGCELTVRFFFEMVDYGVTDPWTIFSDVKHLKWGRNLRIIDRFHQTQFGIDWNTCDVITSIEKALLQKGFVGVSLTSNEEDDPLAIPFGHDLSHIFIIIRDGDNNWRFESYANTVNAPSSKPHLTLWNNYREDLETLLTMAPGNNRTNFWNQLFGSGTVDPLCQPNLGVEISTSLNGI